MTLSLRILALSLFTLTAALPAQAEPFREAFPDVTAQLPAEYKEKVGALELRHGLVTLDGGIAEINLPEGYYFLDAKDARYVLQDVWGNPPSESVLGLIQAKGTTPFDANSWAVTLEFDPLGYVSDEDAEGYDYAALLGDMQAQTLAENPERIKAGYGALQLLGWAQEPHYDKVSRKLYWAKRLHFDGETGDTLNYNIRALGRRGVLIVNFIAGIDQLPEVEAAAPEIMGIVNFTEGHRYADFVPGVDTVAAIGIGGLIAGKVAAKAGLLIVLLAFLKKGAFLILVPLFWLKNKIFGGKPKA